MKVHAALSINRAGHLVAVFTHAQWEAEYEKDLAKFSDAIKVGVSHPGRPRDIIRKVSELWGAKSVTIRRLSRSA